MIWILVVLSVPVYFIFLFIFKKSNIGNNKNRKYITLIPTVIITPIIYFIIILLWISIISYYPKEEFTIYKWHENIHERYRMSKHLIKNDTLIGKTKDEVTEILGYDFYETGNNSIGYYLGHVPGLINIDPDILVIYFENGIVIKVEQKKT
ncbi:MAG: hypothetical protein FWD47_06395 [Treponema sp.]|nr:hypothetical protein [Treponema sp.]